jgi:hypothetical protein
LASHFGCTVGLKDSVTAISFVALGTSLPGNQFNQYMYMFYFVFQFKKSIIIHILINKRHICQQSSCGSRQIRRWFGRKRDGLKCSQRFPRHRSRMDARCLLPQILQRRTLHRRAGLARLLRHHVLLVRHGCYRNHDDSTNACCGWRTWWAFQVASSHCNRFLWPMDLLLELEHARMLRHHKNQLI